MKPPSSKRSKQYAKVIGGLSATVALLFLILVGIVGVILFKWVQKRRRGETNGRDFSILNSEDDGIN